MKIQCKADDGINLEKKYIYLTTNVYFYHTYSVHSFRAVSNLLMV